MLDPATELVPPPSSPTISSISSSDLDTESTGSFFHDRSTTLGTLMGVNFPTIAFRVPSQHRNPNSAAEAASGARRTAAATKKKKKANSAATTAERRRRWWQLCRDGDARPASLGEFLEVERRFGDGAFYGTAAELEGMVAGNQQRNGSRVLFSDGRVLPPQADVDDGAPPPESLCNRFPVSLAGICSGGAA
ncbi:hypothetical protein AAZX31_07G098000 [Glycine max]|uniref:Uncharacterized protein n=2 Tax=Glycine subgen. Soja TaxID=1462606 RepID=K7L0V4_SOYBN|nr:uncharacterized protein At3g17950 [Glycine max]XP_028240144.1 uncharacterized protein At3g17950-like [Glycine soja]KAG5009492.1 hypothetical protein JHK87_018007 [Glycine soja]KAG5022197.1 hypothetical protein JHK85_018539 [Glycine max]KAG5037298.1 hypothetical protein JHK86_018138 [Glycine max]KAG5142372.1 hypothetical protein JHK82_018067 [Glycine max]KAH1086238.1 hypothetical protein GYH30_017966 [Glycine max]|eukprot:XP_003530062.1 uncharacterized protein At3g17950 [Glycine max]